MLCDEKAYVSESSAVRYNPFLFADRRPLPGHMLCDEKAYVSESSAVRYNPFLFADRRPLPPPREPIFVVTSAFHQSTCDSLNRLSTLSLYLYQVFS